MLEQCRRKEKMARDKTLYRHSVDSALKEAHLPRKPHCFSCPINITVITIGRNPQACRLLSKEIPVRVSSVPIGQTALVSRILVSTEMSSDYLVYVEIFPTLDLRWNALRCIMTHPHLGFVLCYSGHSIAKLLQDPLKLFFRIEEFFSSNRTTVSLEVCYMSYKKFCFFRKKVEESHLSIFQWKFKRRILQVYIICVGRFMYII